MIVLCTGSGSVVQKHPPGALILHRLAVAFDLPIAWTPNQPTRLQSSPELTNELVEGVVPVPDLFFYLVGLPYRYGLVAKSYQKSSHSKSPRRPASFRGWEELGTLPRSLSLCTAYLFIISNPSPACTWAS